MVGVSEEAGGGGGRRNRKKFGHRSPAVGKESGGKYVGSGEVLWKQVGVLFRLLAVRVTSSGSPGQPCFTPQFTSHHHQPDILADHARERYNRILSAEIWGTPAVLETRREIRICAFWYAIMRQDNCTQRSNLLWDVVK